MYYTRKVALTHLTSRFPESRLWILSDIEVFERNKRDALALDILAPCKAIEENMTQEG